MTQVFASGLLAFLSVVAVLFTGYSGMQLANAQAVSDELVTYEKESSFIKEFPVPFDERGIRGIAADSQGNA